MADEDVLGYLEELQKKQNLVRFCHVQEMFTQLVGAALVVQRAISVMTFCMMYQ